MCSPRCTDFVASVVRPEEITDKAVLESGAQDVNGSVRPILEAFGPIKYIGTDIQTGHRVDQIVDAINLVDTFGPNSFDVVVSTEQLEHVEDWRTVISNFKRVLKTGGVMFITTRSKGFGYHGYPGDYWRYEIADMQAIFADMEILALQPDPFEPGVFMKARKPKKFKEKDLSTYQLYAISEGG